MSNGQTGFYGTKPLCSCLVGESQSVGVTQDRQRERENCDAQCPGNPACLEGMGVVRVQISLRWHESVGFTRQSLLSPTASSARSSPWPIALRNPIGSPKKRAMATSTASGHRNTVIETTNSSSNGRYDLVSNHRPKHRRMASIFFPVFAVQHGCFRVLALDRSGRRAVRGSRSIPEWRLISTADSVQQQPIAAPGGSEINHGIHRNTRKRESESTSPFRVLPGGNSCP